MEDDDTFEIEIIFLPPPCGECPPCKANGFDKRGPSKASSRKYRDGYDAIFGAKRDESVN